MTTATKRKIRVELPEPHTRQVEFIDSGTKRIIVRAGRRGGKTVGVAIRNVKRFLAGRRQLYTTPTSEQLGKWWFEVCKALTPLIDAGVLKKNEAEHYIERPGTEQRIKGKTAWNADTMRGDYADDLTFDEYQLTDEDAWGVVGVPMLLDNDGDAMFIYTPPSLRSAGVSKARDPRHAAKMFKAAQADTTGRWQAFHFTSHDNPHISEVALAEIIKDMSKKSYRQEILAEDDEIEDAWLVWGAFNEKVCKIPNFTIPNNWDIFTGHDFGTANPAAIFIAQVKLPLPSGAPQYMRYRDFVVWREYLPGGGFSTAQNVEVFKEITKGYEVISRAGGSHQEDEIRQGYSSHGWPITASKIEKVKTQIDRVIGLMELNKIFIFEDCFNLLEEIYNCLWKRDKEGRTTNDIDNEQRYHLSACMRYKFSDFMPETVYSGEEPKAVSYM